MQREKVQLESSAGQEEAGQPKAALPQPDITLYAKSAVLMDADSGRVLYEKNGYTHMPNASTTKIMTCILALEQGNMDDEVKVSSYAASMPKVRLGMAADDTFRLKDLLYSLMLESHNDSAVAIAEHIAGSVEKFAERMNQKAKELGCKDTYFITPNGLDGQNEAGVHGTTAEDLALIMSYCIKNEAFLQITRTASHQFTNLKGTKSYSCNNHNAFLQMMEGALSGKTGFTGNAGYCYVGALRREDRTFVVALLACGWPNNKTYKWADTKALMNYGLEQYQKTDVYEYGKTFPPVGVVGAEPENGRLYQDVTLPLIIPEEKLVVLKRADEEIKTIYDIPESLEAPLKEGQQVGSVRYYLGERQIAEIPVCAGKNVKKQESSWYWNYLLKLFFMEREFQGETTAK
ncbi:D-alanyl-D-alanine carboxypeptidase [Lachnospiraceae bacterium]|nr:D-alanyl-D-alanine carboxypeptidase [Lachnospiraceae bacterium]